MSGPAHAKSNVPSQQAVPQVDKQEEQKLVTPTTRSFGNSGGEDATLNSAGSRDVQTQLNQAAVFGHSFGQLGAPDSSASTMQLKRSERALVTQLKSNHSAPIQKQGYGYEDEDQMMSVWHDDHSAGMSSSDAQMSSPATAISNSPNDDFVSVNNDYGNFNVYPDDFPASLPPPAYMTQDGTASSVEPLMSVRESELGYIDSSMQSIRGGSAGISLSGNEAFQQQTQRDLAYLMLSSPGRELIESIVASGRELSIEPEDPHDPGNAASSTKYPVSNRTVNSDGSRNSGTDANIWYNTENWNPYSSEASQEDWMTRPPAIGLGHELIHAQNFMTGSAAGGQIQINNRSINNLEHQAVGLPFSGPGEREHSENELRQWLGWSLRPRY
ncbi:MAG: M91 family zinc metallopeptidase [Cyanobacteria bacterium P01_B01_bin.77]